MTVTLQQSKSSSQESRDRVALLFREAFARGRGTVIICEGAHLGGMKRIIARLAHILDPRHYSVAWHDADMSGSGKTRPFLLSYWQMLPALGDLLILERSYYYDLMLSRQAGQTGKKRYGELVQEINDFEQSLVQNDYRILKIALDRPKKKLAKDYKKARTDKKDSISLLADDLKLYLKHHKRFDKSLGDLIEATNQYYAPWFRPPVSGYRELEAGVLNFLIAKLEEDLDVNSLEEVKRFDDAMQAMRDRGSGAEPNTGEGQTGSEAESNRQEAPDVEAR